MSLTSRIPHPPGSRYVPIYTWAVARFGFSGAAIIGLLEFFDRAEDMPGQPLASRARIIADLEGVVGRNSVDNALEDLVQRGAITRHIEIRPGKNNITRLVRYGLDLAGIACIISGSKIGSSGKSLNRESREFPESVPKPGPEQVVPYKEEIETEIEEAAPRAHARGTDSAAASSEVSNAKRQHPDRSRLGIECWYPSEDLEADAIVAAHDSDAITAAVAAIKQRLNGAGNKTSPVPALVLAELERQQRKRDAAVSPELRLGASANSEIDPTAQNVGLQLLSATLRAKHHQTTNTKEAAA